VPFAVDVVHIAEGIVDNTNLCGLNNEAVLPLQGPRKRLHKDILEPCSQLTSQLIFLSEEDVDIGRITQTWLQRQEEKLRSQLAAWLEDIFMKSLAWTLQRQDSFVVETTKVGIVNNALSYMNNINSKGHFTFACIQGLGGNFALELRA
jgi:hypothetical protein